MTPKLLSLRTIFDLFCSGQGCSKIAGSLNRDGVPSFSGGYWHPLTIPRMLANETYTGRTKYRQTMVEITRNGREGKKRIHVVSQSESEWIEIPVRHHRSYRQRHSLRLMFTMGRVLMYCPLTTLCHI